MPRSRENARLSGSIGGLMRAATAPSRSEITRQARDALWQRFLDQVPAEITDPTDRQRRAELIRSAHMRRLSLKASSARTKSAQARATTRSES